MDCTEFLARYSEYDDSRVPPTEAARFRAHMGSCDTCARYDRVLRKGRMVARQLRVDGSDDFVSRLDQRLWSEVHRARRSSLRRPARVTAALAAVTVLLATATAVGLLGVHPAASGSVAGGASPDEAVPVLGAPRSRQVAVLPPLDRAEPREWAVERVDPAPTTAYSPLVVGPPAYRRAAGPATPVSTLD